MTKFPNNYTCDGQMNLFDFIPKNNSLVREKCLYNENNPCNLINAHVVARELGIECQYGCCKTCKHNKICGACCWQSKEKNENVTNKMVAGGIVAKCLDGYSEITVYPVNKHINKVFGGRANYCSQDSSKKNMHVLSKCKTDGSDISECMLYSYYRIGNDVYVDCFTNYEDVIAQKTCAATLKECDCHCGVDSCCQYCTNECENRCGYSIKQEKVFDRAKGNNSGWVDNPNYKTIDDYIEEAVLHGTGFVGGKGRVIDFYKQDISSKERTKLIKKEYGLGGAGWPLKGYGLHGYDSFHSDGIKIQYREADGEHEKLISWAKVEKIISKLITEGKYEAK